MAHFALSAIGRDRPGIVAEVTGTLLEHEVNLEDSQMAILGGHFAMMLLLSAPEQIDLAALRADLERTREALGLEAVSLSRVDDLAARTTEPSHVVTLYGADHPGIVHAVAKALAARQINVTDLNTRLVGSDEEPVYVLMLEVALPADCSEADLETLLREVAGEQRLEVSVRSLDQVAL